ncbi:MAG: energy transducer TonB [Myxococcota bacterium]
MRLGHALSPFAIAECSEVGTEEKDRTLADPLASGLAEKFIGTPAPEPVAVPPEALFGSEPLGRLEAYPLTNETPTVRVSPVYPPRAAERGVEGNVVVALLIEHDGTVQHAEVISSEPPGVFERSALKALRTGDTSPPASPADRSHQGRLRALTGDVRNARQTVKPDGLAELLLSENRSDAFNDEPTTNEGGVDVSSRR